MWTSIVKFSVVSTNPIDVDVSYIVLINGIQYFKKRNVSSVDKLKIYQNSIS